MKHLLIVSFDILREHDPTPSYSVASLLAYIQQSSLHREGRLRTWHHAFNLLDQDNLAPAEACRALLAAYPVDVLDYVAISVYAWCDDLAVGLMAEFEAAGYRGKFILGGYQVTATDNEALPSLYPNASHFVKGYGEASLLRILSDEEAPCVLEDRPDFDRLPSIYLSGTIDLPPDAHVPMVRWETKRGCPYSCGFCEWQKALNKSLYEFPLPRVEQELELFRRRHVAKINVLDPTFNIGANYLRVAKLMRDVPSKFAVQARFEALRGMRGEEFLNICAGGNIHLEFGVQTVIEEEMITIGRKNRLDDIRGGLSALNRLGISYEVSLIFGIPGQTVASFLKSVGFLLEHGCSEIECFPLRIPRHSRLESLAAGNCVRETEIPGGYSVRQVVETFSFGEQDWQEMARLADELRNRREGVFLLMRRQGLSWCFSETCERLSLGLSPGGDDQQVMRSTVLNKKLAMMPATAVLFGETDSGLREMRARPVGDDCLVWVLD